MRHFLPFVIIVIISQSAFGQLNVWHRQNPLVQDNTLNAIQMFNMKTTVACGDRGTFIKTTDSGITWDATSLLLFDSLNLYALNFLDSAYGMMCGDGGLIFKTTDGGISWSKIITVTTVTLRGICVVDKSLAIAVGRSGTILKTIDGGKNWVREAFEGFGEFKSIRMLRPDFITITARQGVIYKSNDSGSTWRRITIIADTSLIGNDINGQVFTNDNTALVVGETGGIFKTTDGGTTWTNESVEPISAATLNGIDGKDPSGNVYAAVGDYGVIFNTTNGGNLWSKVNTGIFDSLLAISFSDKFNATAVGKGGIILRTFDGGISWTFLPSKQITPQFNGIAFPKGDTSLGIAVGVGGAIMRTTNGGAYWDLLPAIRGNDLNGVAFQSPTELCVVGQNGIILRSFDAGLTWQITGSGTSKYLKSVSFPTPDFGWTVGDSGIVISTTNGGASWTTHPFSKKRFFTGVSFPDSLHGYMCCEHGVYITTDAGATWAEPDDNTYYIRCTGITAPSADVVSFSYLPCQIIFDPVIPGLLVSYGGVMTSHDSGKNWTNSEFNKFLQGIFFADELHGTAVGIYYPGKEPTGFIIHTTDGGNTWVQQDSHSNDNLFGVSFGTTQAGTVVGSHGNIIRITTDE